jgi:hypothetical protein
MLFRRYLLLMASDRVECGLSFPLGPSTGAGDPVAVDRERPTTRPVIAIAPGPPACNDRSHSVGEFELTLDRLEARLFAQGVHERVVLQLHQPRVAQSQGRFQPLEGLGGVTPLRVDPGVCVRVGIALCCLQFGEHGFRIGMSAEFHR